MLQLGHHPHPSLPLVKRTTFAARVDVVEELHGDLQRRLSGDPELQRLIPHERRAVLWRGLLGQGPARDGHVAVA